MNTTRSAPLAMGAAEFRRIGARLVDAIAARLDAVPERPVTPAAAPEAVRASIDADRRLPEHGTDADALLLATSDLLFDQSLLNGHPRFMGYVSSSPAPIGMLGDLLAAAVNANVGAWQLAPVATEIEAQAVRWIAELIGYPRDGGGLFVSGGNMANLVALIAARAAAADWDVRAEGVGSPVARPLRVYASTETHTWVQKAADVAGIGTDAIRWIPTDQQQRMDPRALNDALDRDRAAGQRPMMVVATAGTVSTGAVDPLPEIGSICRDVGVWLHVDGAYGALAAALPDASADLRALGEADSVAVDPHKWLYAPLEAGCLLVRDAGALRRAFSYHPPYYHFGEESTNYVDYGLQNSRGFRALKVWLALQQTGREGCVRMVADDIRLSQRLAKQVAEQPELELRTQALSITTFRYVPPDLRSDLESVGAQAYLNDLNQALLDRVQRSGAAFLSNAVVHGQYLLRACIVNFHTDTPDVDALPGIVVSLGREVDATLRSPVPLPA